MQKKYIPRILQADEFLKAISEGNPKEGLVDFLKKELVDMSPEFLWDMSCEERGNKINVDMQRI
jgi:hypothetical protein